ncbi:hypothetical protein ACL02S_19165 [Nocardia sp. 004]|uniref:hypothetical protein n=1 Tax=Nocardia sp. 004 TaxID=3385978 RepID=UPI0039A3A0F8
MSVRSRTAEVPGRAARRVEAAERVRSGAAQRAYTRRRARAEHRSDTALLPAMRRSATAGHVPFVAAVIALLGCGLALTLLLTTRAAEDSYQLSDARATNQRLADERAALQREVEAADSAPELAARARELGMIPAEDPARLVIGPNGEVTVIGTPTPAQGTPVPPLNTSPVPGTGNIEARGERVLPVQLTPSVPAPDQPDPAAHTDVQVTGAPTHTVPVPPIAVEADQGQPVEAAAAQAAAPASRPEAGTAHQASAAPDGGIR